MEIKFDSEGRIIEEYAYKSNKQEKRGKMANQPHVPPSHDRSCASDVYLHGLVEEKRKKAEAEQKYFEELQTKLNDIVSSIPSFIGKYNRYQLSEEGKRQYSAEARQVVDNSNLSIEAKLVLHARVKTGLPIPYFVKLKEELSKGNVKKEEHVKIVSLLIQLNSVLSDYFKKYSEVSEIPHVTGKKRESSTRESISVPLKEKIIKYLKNYPNSLAREIAVSVGVTTHEVNSCIFRELKRELRQDATYRWSIK